MATKKKEEEKIAQAIEIYECEDGMLVTILPIPPMLLQKVMSSVEMPKRPMYEAKVGFGSRTEEWPMDELSAEQTEHGRTRWEYYEEQLTFSQSKQNEKVTMAAFRFGTACEIPEDGWAVKQEFLDIEVPTEPDMRRAHYLATELSATDVAGLMAAVMRTLKLPEELVADAEASFRDSVRDRPEGAGQLEVAE